MCTFIRHRLVHTSWWSYKQPLTQPQNKWESGYNLLATGHHRYTTEVFFKYVSPIYWPSIWAGSFVPMLYCHLNQPWISALILVFLGCSLGLPYSGVYYTQSHKLIILFQGTSNHVRCWFAGYLLRLWILEDWPNGRVFLVTSNQEFLLYFSLPWEKILGKQSRVLNLSWFDSRVPMPLGTWRLFIVSGMNF